MSIKRVQPVQAVSNSKQQKVVSMQNTILIIIALGFFGLANAQIKSGGACPNPPVQDYLNISTYAGSWFEYAKYPTALEGNGKCVTVTYTQTCQTEMNIVGTMVVPSTNKTSSLMGAAKQTSNAKFKVTYNVPTISPRTLWILSTDYDSYGIVYSCQPAGCNSHNIFLWIITRSQKPSAATVAKVKNILSSKGLSFASLAVTDQRNC